MHLPLPKKKKSVILKSLFLKDVTYNALVTVVCFSAEKKFFRTPHAYKARCGSDSIKTIRIDDRHGAVAAHHI